MSTHFAIPGWEVTQAWRCPSTTFLELLGWPSHWLEHQAMCRMALAALEFGLITEINSKTVTLHHFWWQTGRHHQFFQSKLGHLLLWKFLQCTLGLLPLLQFLQCKLGVLLLLQFLQYKLGVLLLVVAAGLSPKMVQSHCTMLAGKNSRERIWNEWRQHKFQGNRVHCAL